MIDLMKTRLGEVLQRSLILDEVQAWFDSITPDLKTTIIREWIQTDQLTRLGVDEDGSIIGFYSEFTEFLSGGRKRAGDHYTLDDTGQFYSSMFIQVLVNELVIDADFRKMEDQDWWREEILGLTDENLQKLINRAKDGYINYARRILGIN